MNHDYADASQWRGTTILTVRKNGKVVVIGDGQVSAGNTGDEIERPQSAAHCRGLCDHWVCGRDGGCFRPDGAARS